MQLKQEHDAPGINAVVNSNANLRSGNLTSTTKTRPAAVSHVFWGGVIATVVI